MTYKLYGRAGWGSTIVEAQLVWYGLPFTFEPVDDLFKSPDARKKLEKVKPLAQVPTRPLGPTPGARSGGGPRPGPRERASSPGCWLSTRPPIYPPFPAPATPR